MKNFLLSIALFLTTLSAFSQAGVKISALPPKSGNGSGGFVPVVIDGQTTKMPADSVGAGYVNSKLITYDSSTMYFDSAKNWIGAKIGGSSVTETIKWSVLDSLSTPPGSPATGNIYLVGTSPTGLFSGHANTIARFDSTATYLFSSPASGNLLYNAINSFVSQWNGTAWIRISTPSASTRYQRNAVPYVDPITGVLKTDSTKISFSEGGDLSVINGMYFNFGRASLSGSFGGLQINVGSGFAGTSVDASKSIGFSNRGTEYGRFYSAGGVNYFRVKTNVGFEAYGSSSTNISSDTTANKPLAVNASGNLVRMDNWPGGSVGGSQDLNTTLAYGNTSNQQIATGSNTATAQITSPYTPAYTAILNADYNFGLLRYKATGQPGSVTIGPQVSEYLSGDVTLLLPKLMSIPQPTVLPISVDGIYADNNGNINTGTPWLKSEYNPNNIQNTNTGNVGIGSTVDLNFPKQKLDVLGNIVASGSIGSNTILDEDEGQYYNGVTLMNNINSTYPGIRLTQVSSYPHYTFDLDPERTKLYNGKLFYWPVDGITGKYYALTNNSDGSISITGTATLNFPSTSSATSSDLTIAVTGAVVGDVVSLGSSVPPANSCFTAFVSAADIVTVRFNNYSTASIDPSSATFKVKVLQ